MVVSENLFFFNHTNTSSQMVEFPKEMGVLRRAKMGSEDTLLYALNISCIFLHAFANLNILFSNCSLIVCVHV